MIYYEILKPFDTIAGERYRQQNVALDGTLEAKQMEYIGRYDKMTLHHDSIRSGVPKIVQETSLGNLTTPDIAPSDYHLFRSVQSAL